MIDVARVSRSNLPLNVDVCFCVLHRLLWIQSLPMRFIVHTLLLMMHIARLWTVADPKILKRGWKTIYQPVLIYRKYTQRSICLLHGKTRLFWKKILKRGWKTIYQPVLIYRKYTQRSICLLHGKTRLFWKKFWANRGVAAPTVPPWIRHWLWTGSVESGGSVKMPSQPLPPFLSLPYPFSSHPHQSLSIPSFSHSFSLLLPFSSLPPNPVWGYGEKFIEWHPLWEQRDTCPVMLHRGYDPDIVISLVSFMPS